jgi:hypothetical protein
MQQICRSFYPDIKKITAQHLNNSLNIWFIYLWKKNYEAAFFIPVCFLLYNNCIKRSE